VPEDRRAVSRVITASFSARSPNADATATRKDLEAA
jgi:hypothetical protein